MMNSPHPRIKRESKTVAIMIGLYCRKNHSSKGLCPECSDLLDYAQRRLQKCPFQGGKTTCARCPAHCYRPMMRERIKAVMRYSGPRLLFRHPVAAIRHLLDGRRREPLRSLDEKNA